MGESLVYNGASSLRSKAEQFYNSCSSNKEVLALCQHYQDRQTVRKHHVTIYCNVIGSHCTAWWDEAYTLSSPDSPVFPGGGWLTTLNMTCTLWKQVWLTMPNFFEATAATVTGHQKVTSCSKEQVQYTAGKEGLTESKSGSDRKQIREWQNVLILRFFYTRLFLH